MNNTSDAVLLSIHPQHVEKIIEGSKRFELRRRIPTHIKKIAIYSTAPESRIVATSTVEHIFEDNPSSLWAKVQGAAGILRSFYDQYFTGVDKAFAIKLGRLSLINKNIKPSHSRLSKTPPQSYTYLNQEQIKWLEDSADKTLHSHTKKVFVGGIHASGKSYLAKNIIASYGYHTVSASQIIKDEQGEINDDKSVIDLDSNQKRLINGLRKIEQLSSHIAIDGHFSLVGQNGMPEKVPLSVFRHINPGLIILATPPPAVIEERLSQRKESINLAISIEDFQKYEIEHAREIASQLSVPLLLLDTNQDKDTLHREIKKVLSS